MSAWRTPIRAGLGVLAFLLAAAYAPLALLCVLIALGCWQFVFAPIAGDSVRTIIERGSRG